MQKIQTKRALTTDAVILDTRSPKEYAIDHLPGAVNLPILDDDERKAVGMLYKGDPKKAFDLGYAYYHEKLPTLTSYIESIDTDKKVIVYCWRGGMRSKAITELVTSLGYDAFQLEGGYKAYRRHVREKLSSYQPSFRFIVLYGRAGCGKTDILKEIKPSIDLEGLAQHRSSLFGSIGLNPNTQKMFDTLLLQTLDGLRDERYVFIEGESRKVGDVFIPDSIFRAMKKGIAIKVESSIEKRSERIVRDYFSHNEDERIKEIILSLKRDLSGTVTDQLLGLMEKKEYHTVSKILLEAYYDPRYDHQLDSISYETIIDSDSDPIKALESFRGSL